MFFCGRRISSSSLFASVVTDPPFICVKCVRLCECHVHGGSSPPPRAHSQSRPTTHMHMHMHHNPQYTHAASEYPPERTNGNTVHQGDGYSQGAVVMLKQPFAGSGEGAGRRQTAIFRSNQPLANPTAPCPAMSSHVQPCPDMSGHVQTPVQVTGGGGASRL